VSLLAPGSVIADFRIEDVVGRGGMGVVYRATELSLGRPVALKVIAPHLAEDPGFKARFVRESRLSASLDHPHIVPVYGAGEADGVPYIAMRFVEGVNLRMEIAAKGRLEPIRAVRVIEQIAFALDAAHERGLVHRDVKPANVLISRHGDDEHAYLTDFGVTKTRTSTASRTGTGEWAGTLDYVAPEQLRGERVDARADVYSLGCVLYQCLTAHVPFPRDSDLATLWAHISEAPPSASDVFPDVPAELSALVSRALAKVPEQRYASAGEFARAVRGALAHSPSRGGTVERPTRPSAPPARPRRVAGPLYERERELSQAAAELDAACSGSGRILIVEGQAGIGKSRLLGELSGMAEARGFAVYSACGIELEREFAYGVARQLFEYSVHHLSAEERASLFRGAAGLAESLLLRPGEPGSAADRAGESVEDRMFAALHGLYWFCAELSERSPVLLAIDDADRADQASLRFLAHLAPRLEGLPVAVAVARRPANAGAPEQLLAQIEQHAALRLSPPPLTPAGSASVVAERLGEGDPEFFAACHRAAQGNPFLLGELCATLRAEGVTPTAAATPLVERLGPRNIARSSLTRIGSVAPGARRLVQAAALMGQDSELRHAAELAGLDLSEAAPLADSLVELGVLASSAPLRFVHPVVRTAILEDQPAGTRALLHARAARLLARESAAGEMVCAHLMQSAPSGDAWVVDQLLGTAHAALEDGAPESAASLLARALVEPPSGEQPTRVLFELGRAEALGPDPASAVEHLRAALGGAKDRGLRDNLVAELLSVLWHLGRRGELLELARAELARCERDGAYAESRRRLEAALVAALKFNVGHYDELDARLDKLAPELTADTRPERAILAVLAQRRVERAEPVEQAVDAARLALEGGLLADHAPSLRAPAGVALRALIESDAHEDAARWIGEGLELARKRGSRIGQLTAHRFLAELAYSNGDLAAAEADARLVAASWQEFHSLAAFCAAATLAQALVASGRPDQARDALAELGDGRQYPGFPNAVVSLARGDLAMADGDVRAARAHFVKAGEDFPYSAWRPGAAAAALMIGDRDEATVLADEELARARRFGAPRALGMALRVAGLCHGSAQGLQMIEQSVEVLGESRARLELALSLCELGAALRRAKRRADARPLLREALELAHRCGAEPLEERVRTELRASGARPRRSAVSGVEALTASELRVCRLAADGMTNAEIAQTLFVTRRTVETHLGSAYRKLDIKSRGELPDALRGGVRPEPVAG
jgi:DNA-binding CsgD family transcriptional regulator